MVPPWPPFEPGDSLPTFAARMIDALPASDDLYLGGSSFGGMVALEIAARVRTKGVILIGSGRSPESIAPFARHLRGVMPIVPGAAYHPWRWTRPLARPLLGPLTPEQRRLFWTMALGTPTSFLKWGARAILSWVPSAVAVPVHHIHGADDRLIPVARVRADRIVPGGGHLLTLSHPGDVNAFLRDVLDGPTST